MRSILVALAARILRVSQIQHGNETLTHYRGLRDDGMRGHRGCGSTDDSAAPRSLEITEAPASRQAGHGR